MSLKLVSIYRVCSVVVIVTTAFLNLSYASNRQPLKYLSVTNETWADLSMLQRSQLNEQLPRAELELSQTLPKDLSAHLVTSPIELLFSSKLKVDGLFLPEHPKMIFLRPTLIGGPSFYEILYHELFHAWHHTWRTKESDWTKEGLAQEFSFAILGSLGGSRLLSVFEKPNVELQKTYDFESASSEWYGKAALAMRFALNRCYSLAQRPKNLIWSLAGFGSPKESDKVGWDFVAERLNSQPAGLNEDCKTPKGLRRAFALALVINRPALSTDLRHFIVSTTLRPKPSPIIQKPAVGDFWFFERSLAQDDADQLNAFLREGYEVYQLASAYPYVPIAVSQAESVAEPLRYVIIAP
jgi:hypothetical protein